jgi:hypothetical protein
MAQKPKNFVKNDLVWHLFPGLGFSQKGCFENRFTLTANVMVNAIQNNGV